MDQTNAHEGSELLNGIVEKKGWPPALNDRFEDVESLSVGRISTVFRAIDKINGQVVALRVLHPHVLENSAVRKRLRRELAAARRLDHPGILSIYDLLESDDYGVIVMEYVEGRTLRELVRDEGAIPWERAASILAQAAQALEHAHQRGVLHRDLSAHHVMINKQGEAKLVGFGLARVEELVGLTMHTRVLGAVEAMAPERLLGMDYDGRADIYSLGVIGRELVTGVAPVASEYGFLQHLGPEERTEKDSSDQWPENLDPQGRLILQRASARDVSIRFATPGQLLRALKGNYDRLAWEGWTSRATRSCPKCNALVLEGLAKCVECDFHFRRLVQKPGAGRWSVRILSEADIFEKDVWFEVNTAPPELTDAQFQSLMLYLNQYDDTARFADGHPVYLSTPYDLLVELEREEAERIAKDLEEVGLIVRVCRDSVERNAAEIQNLGIYAIADNGQKVRAISDGKKKTSPPGKKKDSTGKASFRFSDGIFPLIYLLLAMFISFWFFLVGLLVSISTYFLLRRYLRPPQETIVIRSNDEIRSRETMISTSALTEVGWVDRDIIPRNTGSVLKKLSNRSLKKEIHEVLTLALSLKRRNPTMAGEEIRKVLEEILHIGEHLQEFEDRRSELSTAELIDRLASTEERLKASESGERSAELIDERVEILSKLEERDELEHKRVLLQAALLQARGELVERASPSRAALRSKEEGEEVVLEIQSLLQGAREVEEIVGVVQ